MKAKLNKLNMPFDEVLARLAQTPKAAIDKAEKERQAKDAKAKLIKPPKTPRA